VAQYSNGTVISRRKYALNVLKETGMFKCKPVDTPMDRMLSFFLDSGSPTESIRYQILLANSIKLYDLTKRHLIQYYLKKGHHINYQCS